MARLIDVDALCAELQREIGSPEGDEKLMKVNFIITRAPTWDADPVRHGQWEKLSAKEWPWTYRCTACGLPEDGRTVYCPNCGARMEV